MAIALSLGSLPLAMSHAAAYLRQNATTTGQRYLKAIAEHMREAPKKDASTIRRFSRPSASRSNRSRWRHRARVPFSR